jgi:pyruvate/2-oxoglutarate dehydrogenase complex dihydrolipoamide acyltransferase (E2) component
VFSVVELFPTSIHVPTDFTLPELGENITAGDVLRVLVKPGDTLDKDQPVLELETDKATIEVPSSVAGTVKDVKVKAGDKVKVGQAILTVDDGAAAAAQPSPSGDEAKASPAKETKASGGGDAKPASGGAVGANTAAKVPDDNAGLEQHVEGAKRETADKAGTKPRTASSEAADAEAATAAAPLPAIMELTKAGLALSANLTR